MVVRANGDVTGGRSLHLASCHKDWPIFEHLLPEIAFVGHSNSGKVCDTVRTY